MEYLGDNDPLYNATPYTMYNFYVKCVDLGIVLKSSYRKYDRRFPDFFIVGAPKCGTTSLYTWLSTHPDLYMPVKEPGYFSQDILPLGKTREFYLTLFKDAPEGALIGESTPKYLYSVSGLRELHTLNPDARIIVTLRPPVDLVVSFHGQMLKEGNESETSLEKAWNLIEERRERRKIPKLCRSPKLLDYSSWGKIGTRVMDLLSVFKREQILFILLEDLQNHPLLIYRQILAHLGVGYDGRTVFPAKNIRKEIRNWTLHRAGIAARRLGLPLLESIYRHRGGRGTGLLKILAAFNVKQHDGKERISGEFADNLREFYFEEIELLQKAIDRDLSHWR